MGNRTSKTDSNRTITRPKTAKGVQNSILKPSQKPRPDPRINGNYQSQPTEQPRPVDYQPPRPIDYQQQPQQLPPPVNYNTIPQQQSQINNNSNGQYNPSQQQFKTQPEPDRPYRPPPQPIPQVGENLQSQRRSAMQQKPTWGEPLATPRRPTYDIQKWKALIKMLQENLKLTNYVFSRPRRTFKSMNELGVYIKNSPAQSDIEIAWVIYLWISQNINYDVDGFRTGFYNDLDLEPDSVLQSGRTISWGYAHFFEELCRANDIECVSISGFAKGLTFRQNHAFIDPNHEWNAIKLNGVWQFVDCTWGTGYVSDEFVFYRKFIPHYFLTPPQIFIYDHYSEQYQLQPQKMSIRRFEKLPLLKLEYFLNDVECLSHDIYGSIRPIERNFKMEFICDEDTILLASLEKLNGEIIERAIAIQHDRVKNKFELLMTLPNGRDSLLNLFTRKNGEESQFCGEVYLHAPASVEASVVSVYDSDSEEEELEQMYVAVKQPQRKAKKVFNVMEVIESVPDEDVVEVKPMPTEWDLELQDKGPYEIVVPPEYHLAVQEKYDYYVKDQYGRTSKLMALDYEK